MEMVVVIGRGKVEEGWMVLGGRSRSNEKDNFEMLTVLCDVISENQCDVLLRFETSVEHP